MKRFNYKGKELTLSELLPFSVVPEKTLRGRLFSGNSLWSVESALNTPFGEKGKTDEMSVNDSCVIEKRAKQPKQQGWKRPDREKGTFYCVQCRKSKKIALLGRTYKNHNSMCTSCVEKAGKTSTMSKREKAIKRSQNKERQKRYNKPLSDKQVFFITGENK